MIGEEKRTDGKRERGEGQMGGKGMRRRKNVKERTEGIILIGKRKRNG